MKHNTYNNSYNNDDDADALSLKDLQMYDQTSSRSSPRTSLTQEVFEFFPILSNPSPTTDNNILFCGKLIHKEMSHDNYFQNKDKSSSFRLPRERKINPVRRSGSSRDQGSRDDELVKKVKMSSASSVSSKWKRRLFMFMTVPEMEMRSIKGRKAPGRMYSVVEGGGDDRKKMKMVDKNTNKVRLYSVFEKLACVSTNLTNQVI